MDRAHIVFLTTVAVIAVHVADDSFVNPPDGTSAGDHLVSGIVPLMSLAAAAAVYLRSRPGVRAVLALVLGLFGVVAGAEGWYYTLNVGASGDDYTGLLALPAGLLLLLLAAVTLWRSRRVEGNRLWRYARRGLIGAVGLVALALIGPFLMSYAYTHIARAVVPAADLGDADYLQVAFETSDALELQGWYIPSRNGTAVISFAGRDKTQIPARFLARHGYGVLLFDRRGEGKSEGAPNAFGWGGAKDIHAAIAFLRGRPDVDSGRIGGIGYSVGGEMMLEAAAGTDALRAVISEGAGICSVREANELDSADKWLSVTVWAAMTAGTAVFADHRPPPNLKDLVSRIAPRPVFLIYAAQPQGGEQLSAEYFEVAREPKQLWRTDSGHTGGYDADPAEYERRVVQFLDDALR